MSVLLHFGVDGVRGRGRAAGLRALKRLAMRTVGSFGVTSVGLQGLGAMDIRGLLDAAEVGLLPPIILAVTAVALYRVSFRLHSVRRQSRRDFIEYWKGLVGSDRLSRAVAIRHLFGAYLPVCVIDRALASTNPGRTLLDTSEAWSLLQFDESSGSLRWRCKWHEIKLVRVADGLFMLLAMYLSTWLAIVSGTVATQVDWPGAWVGWVLVPGFLGFAVSASLRRDALICGGRLAISLSRSRSMS